MKTVSIPMYLARILKEEFPLELSSVRFKDTSLLDFEYGTQVQLLYFVLIRFKIKCKFYNML